MDKQLTILLPNDVPLELILVEPGYFIMGSEAEEAHEDEGPEHIVHITHPFCIGKYPVTQAQWQAVMGKNPSHFTGPQRPVENTSWLDIVDDNQYEDGTSAFLTLINNYLAKGEPDLAATHELCLPTEAEWEYAAKGGTGFPKAELSGKTTADLYPAYAGSDRLVSCGWFSRNSIFETKPVGIKQANELGLYDMGGNVMEWCHDFYDEDTYKNRKEPRPKNPVGSDSGGIRVLRGGNSWGNAGNCRSACREHNHSAARRDRYGFRLVLSPSSGSGTSS